MRFKDLEIGDRFVFACEEDPRFEGVDIERGPWRKVSTRRYMEDSLSPTINYVGTINTLVIRKDKTHDH